jgi:hypothetical protein
MSAKRRWTAREIPDQSEVPGVTVEVMSLDLASLASIERFAGDFVTTHDRLDVGYYGPDGWLERTGFPTRRRSSRRSHDESAAKQLWELSVELTGVDYAALERTAGPAATRRVPGT